MNLCHIKIWVDHYPHSAEADPKELFLPEKKGIKSIDLSLIVDIN